MATCSSIFVWEIPWTKEPGGLTVHGVTKQSDMTQRLNNEPNNSQKQYKWKERKKERNGKKKGRKKKRERGKANKQAR